MNVLNNASGVNAALGISNNLAPLPLNDEPLFTETPPLTNNEPVNCEPLSIDSTLNPYSGETDAVTEPLAILNASSESADCGILNNPLPSPVIIPSTVKEPVTSTEPVISCLSSVNESPNIFEPEE